MAKPPEEKLMAIGNGQETIENESTQYLTDDEVFSVARKKAYGIQLTAFPTPCKFTLEDFKMGGGG